MSGIRATAYRRRAALQGTGPDANTGQGDLVETVQTFPASVHEAERCWYDTSRWQNWVDGLDRVLETREPWPMVGGGVTWESGPAGAAA